MRYLLTVAVVLLSACSNPALTFDEMAGAVCDRLTSECPTGADGGPCRAALSDCTERLLGERDADVAAGCEAQSFDRMRCEYDDLVCDAETAALRQCRAE